MKTFSNLPALKHLGELSGRLPVVIIDSREQTPLPIIRLPIIRAGLYSGDYSVAGCESVFAVERKSIDDLVSCCASGNRERFEHELHRLRGFEFKRLLIIGQRERIESQDYKSKITPQAVMGSLQAWEVRYNIPVVWSATPELGATIVELWAWYYSREIVERANRLFRAVKN